MACDSTIPAVERLADLLDECGGNDVMDSLNSILNHAGKEHDLQRLVEQTTEDLASLFEQTNLVLQNKFDHSLSNSQTLISHTNKLMGINERKMSELGVLKDQVDKEESAVSSLMKGVEATSVQKKNIDTAMKFMEQIDLWFSSIGQLRRLLAEFSVDHEMVRRILSHCQSSLTTLRHLKNHNDRKTKLQMYQNQWFTLMRPYVREIVESGDKAKIAEQHILFKELGFDMLVIEVCVDTCKAISLSSCKLDFRQAKDISQAGEQLFEFLGQDKHCTIDFCEKIFGNPLAFVRHRESLIARFAQDLSAVERRSDILSSIRFKVLCDNFVRKSWNDCRSLNTDANSNSMANAFQTIVFSLYGVVSQRVHGFIAYERNQIDQILKLDLEAACKYDEEKRRMILSKMIHRLQEELETAMSHCAEFTNNTHVHQMCRLIEDSMEKLVVNIRHLVPQCDDDLARQFKRSSLNGQSSKALDQLAINNDRTLMFKHLLSLIALAGDAIKVLMQIDSRVENVLTADTILAKSSNEGMSDAIICQDVALKLFVDRFELKADTARLISVKANASTYCPLVMNDLSDQVSRLFGLSVSCLLQSVSAKLKTYCKHELAKNSKIKSKSLISDLPSYSMLPSTNISESGQYLLMLPGTIDQFLQEDREKLATAMQSCRKQSNVFENAEDISSIWIDESCRSVVDSLVNQLSQLALISITPAMAKQIVVDLEYLQAILEDIGCCGAVDSLKLILLSVTAPKTDTFEAHNDSSNLSYAELLRSVPSNTRHLCRILREAHSS